MGATYIKLGQVIASSPSLFPEAYVKEFQRCLDSTEPVPYPVMEKILKKELGVRKLKQFFAEIDPEPLASASIAQVYAARLKTGEDVVIKIQRPGVEEILVTDLVFLQTAAQLFEWIVPTLKHASITGILSEIRKSVLAECDFIQEAENIRLFTDFLEQTGKRGVVAPRVYPDVSTKKVLTMERLYGIPLTDRKRLLENADNPAQSIGAAFETWFESITKCPVFHADLHAGNLMLLHDGRVGFIDFGVVGSISYQTRSGMKSLIEGMICNDFRKMAGSMIMIGLTGEQVDRFQLEEDLRNLYDRFTGNDIMALESPIPPRGDSDQFLLQMVRIGEKHGIRFPSEFTLLLKQFLYFDSYRDIMMQSDVLFREMMEMAGLDDDF
ncbi:MAG: AarF/ABC1/UbiB kinase family protein [Desulfobacteraceae bacterium]|nr:MAG: AarF/ABC1/UbiB kinase family protein [Desulfobacteraceae bacterium]